MLPPILTSGPAQQAGSLSSRELLICQRSACSAWLLALHVWNKTCEVLSRISRSCRGWELPLLADTESCRIAVPVSPSQPGLLLHFLVVLEEIPFCMLYNTARISSARVMVSLGVWAYSQTFPVCILGMLLGWRADLGVSHLPWITPMEKWLPCSRCHSQRLLLQPQRGQRCSRARWWASQAEVLTRHHGLFWLTLVTTCHCPFNGFWKVAYLKCSVSFGFLKGCVILWCFLPASASHPSYPRLPDSQRRPPAPAGADATAPLRWTLASAGPHPGPCISHFLGGMIALYKEGQMQSLFGKAYQKLLLL